MEDFEQQERVFKEEVAQAKERNAQKKASLHLTIIMRAECVVLQRVTVVRGIHVIYVHATSFIFNPWARAP